MPFLICDLQIKNTHEEVKKKTNIYVYVTLEKTSNIQQKNMTTRLSTPYGRNKVQAAYA